MHKQKAQPKRRGNLRLKPAINKATGVVFLTGCSEWNTERWLRALREEYLHRGGSWFLPTPATTFLVSLAEGRVILESLSKDPEKEPAVAVYRELLEELFEAELQQAHEQVSIAA